MKNLILGIIGAICLGQAATGKDTLSQCFEHVFERYFEGSTMLLLVWSESESEWTSEIVRFAMTSTKWTVYLSDERYSPPPFDYFYLRMDHQRAENVVVVVGANESDAIWRFGKLAENPLWDSRARILVVTGGESDGQLILDEAWDRKRALNVVVMSVGEESTRFSMRNPFSGGNDSVLCPDDTLKEESWVNQVPVDFQGYTFRMGVTYSEPYVMKPRTPGIYRDGVEIRIVKALSHNLNFTVEYLEAPKGESPLIAWVNRTPSGLFGLLSRGEADMIFVGLRNRFDRNILCDPLMMHVQDRSVWIVPHISPERNWKSFYLVFTVPVWLTIAAFGALFPIVLYLLDHCNRQPEALTLTDCILQALSNQLYYPPCFAMKKMRLNLFLFVMYLYSLHITSSYVSHLVLVWTTPLDSFYLETPEEAADAGLVAYLYPSGKPGYNQSNHALWNKILRPLHHIYSDNYTKTLTLISRYKSAYTLMLENVAKYEISKQENHYEQMVHIIDKEFSSYHVSFFLSRGHPVTALFNRKVQQLVESGVVYHWLEKFLARFRRNRRRQARVAKEEPIRLMHLRVILCIAAVCWSLSVLAFFAELCVGKRCRKPRVKPNNPAKPRQFPPFSTSLSTWAHQSEQRIAR